MNEKKFKILRIVPFPIYPPNDGGSMYVFYISKALAEEGHKIDFVVIDNSNNEINAPEPDIKENENYFGNIIYIKPKNKIRALFSFQPYRNIRNKPDNKEIRQIKKIIYQEKYDFVFFDGAFSYPYWKAIISDLKNLNAKCIYIAHNIDYIDILNRSKDFQNPLLKLFYWFDHLKLKNLEKKYIQNFKYILSISPEDIKILNLINKNASIHWMPPIIEIKEKIVSDVGRDNLSNFHYKILFTGSLNSSSNINAVRWFAKEVMPIIRDRLNICLMIVGRNPSREIIKLQEKFNDIFIFANVESLIPFYKEADLVVVPLFNDAGVKIKLIEALKYRKKVVSRPEGVSGAGLSNVIPTATTSEEFAQKCIEVLEGKIDYTRIWEDFNIMYNNEEIINTVKEELYSLIESK
jgi:glycosyltransferase involved in cell wall biosynthesis